MPGVVEKKNVDNTVNVRPAIKKIYADGKKLEYSLLMNVPVMYPQGAAFRMTWPLAKNDPVWLVFSQASIEKWKKSGGVVLPGDQRHHFESDCVCYPGGAHVGGLEMDNEFLMKYRDSEIKINAQSQVSINGNLTVDL